MPIAKQAGNVKQSSGPEVKHTPAVTAPEGGAVDIALLQDVVSGSGGITPQHALAAQRRVGNEATQALVQRRSGVGMEGGDLDATLAHQIQSARGGGTSLDGRLGTRMSTALGTDFSAVRVHHDAQSDTLNRSLNAKAFTLGNDIFFSHGAYQPGSSGGQQLIAHELTHVVQQGGAKGNKLQAKLSVGPADDHYEREADQVAQSVLRMSGSSRPAAHASRTGVQRFWNPFKKKNSAPSPQYSRFPSAGGQNADAYKHALLANPQMLSDAERQFLAREPQWLNVKQNANKLPGTGTQEGSESYKEALRSDPSLLSEKERQYVKGAPGVLAPSKPSNYLAPEQKKGPKPPTISGPKAPKPSDDPAAQQQDAQTRIAASLAKAQTIATEGKQKSAQIRQQNAPTAAELSIRKSAVGVAKDASKRAQKAEAGAFRSTNRANDQFDFLLKTIEGTQKDVLANGELVTKYLASGNMPGAQQYSGISANLADMAARRVADAEKQLAAMESTAQVDAAAARAGLDKAYDSDKEKPRDWAGVERSASDAAMAMEQNLYKMMRYHAFLQMDAAVIKKHVIEKTTEVAQLYGEFAPTRIIAAGRARANLKAKAGPLSEERALKLLADAGKDTSQEEAAQGGAEYGAAMAAMEKTPNQDLPEAKGNKYLNPSLKEGKWAGFKNKVGGGLMKAGSTIAGGAKSLGKLAISPFMALGRLMDRKLFRRDRGKRIAKARAVQGLELMAKFQVESEQRLAEAEKYVGETTLLHQKSLETYDKIDLDKKESELGAGDAKLNSAILLAGQSWSDVGKTGGYRDTLKKYRDDVVAESGKYSKFGARAMGTGKKVAMTLLGLLTGTGLKVLTGGLFRLEKTEVGAGYSATLQKKTIWDDLKQAYRDFKEATHLKGMGGKWGARIYAVLQGFSFFLGIARTLCSTIALYLTMTGVSAPVAGGFASAALYSAIAKAAVDLALLIWTGIASQMTVDPRARSKLKGRIARHGMEFGEGVATAATAGMLAGITADPGAFVGHVTPKVFDTSQSTGGGAMNWSQHLPVVDKEFYFMKMGANVAISQAIPLSATLGTTIAEGVNDSNVRANKMKKDTATQEHAQNLAEQKQKAGESSKEAKGKLAWFKAKIVGAAESAAKAIYGRATSKEKNDRYEMVLGILNNIPRDVNAVDTHAQILPEGSLV